MLLQLAILPAPLYAQPQPADAAQAVVGTAVSSGRNALTVRTDDGRYVVFIVDRDTKRPGAIPDGARVSVRPMGEPGADDVRTAAVIDVIDTPAAKPAKQDPIPDAVRRAERQIERNARFYKAGVRAGVALDPELVSVGAHATFGPIFTPRLFVRPNVEVAYGELTTLFAVNLEAIYRLAALRTGTAWAPYAGGGPTLGFSHRGSSVDDGRSFDFGDLDLNNGLSLLFGLERPSGVFIELKSTVYTNPHLRLLIGFTF